MKVVVSKILGFCGGVKRTISLATDATKRFSGSVYSDGELVHNSQVMEELENAGIKKLKDCDLPSLTPQDCIVTRAHGIKKDRRALLESCSASVIDGTCPHVAKISKIIENAASSDRDVVIVGDRNHPEVIALIDSAICGKCFVVSSGEEVAMLPKNLNTPLLVSQSTIVQTTFDGVGTEFLKIYRNAELVNTICAPSLVRQKAVAALKTRGAQAIVVIGGKHSNNTLALVLVAKNSGLPVFQVETIDDLQWEELKKISIIGVASGASTEQRSVEGIVRFLEKF
jgi:4-hydroxy-3-methylbut-2-enyl diphosphate reductase